ncbi:MULTISPECIES: ribbon-helix-helix protein, CopG family [Burkholderia]|uniref:CopG family transcriptional regulator n=1 Tax=Burkholderia aenigmatica TaxID=2015348 RepID=A0A228I3P1_9BURK|nr:MULTISPECIES: ribbon-helix-helix protein, CopG family [Burkholderia]MBN3840026.1 ribbon-helix-helix protein, CopG family [Burkholderia sp. Ac-20349]OXI37041.1 CopG family transcriptional regulator [Burkholderia aenigmatica]
MNRIPVDLSDDQHAALARIAAHQSRSPAEIIRDAIDAYIALQNRTLADNVFGLWKGRVVAYQEDFRSEW